MGCEGLKQGGGGVGVFGRLPDVAPDATVHTAGVPLTPAAIIPAVTREEVPHLHLTAAVSMPHDKPAAHSQGTDVATF